MAHAPITLPSQAQTGQRPLQEGHTVRVSHRSR
jgi:hypothetical protein